MGKEASKVGLFWNFGISSPMIKFKESQASAIYGNGIIVSYMSYRIVSIVQNQKQNYQNAIN